MGRPGTGIAGAIVPGRFPDFPTATTADTAMAVCGVYNARLGHNVAIHGVQVHPILGRCWNWEGKLLEMSWPLLLTAVVPAFSPKRIGLQFRTAPGSWLALLAVCALFAILTVPFMFSMGGHISLNTKLPDFLFEVTAPGLGEEFVYRGVLLLLVNELFGRPWRALGAQFGWGLIIVSVLFGLLHGIVVNDQLHVHIYWTAMIIPCAIGVVLAWLREYSGSVWPCVIFHNFVDLISTFFSFA